MQRLRTSKSKNPYVPNYREGVFFVSVKELYYDNLDKIVARFGAIQLIPLRQAAEFVGCDHRSLSKAKDLQIKKLGGRYYVSAVGLARWLS